MSDPTSLRDFAERYGNLGFSFIPLIPKTKFPKINSWSEYQRRRPTIAEAQTWFDNGQNIAIVCGAVSGGLRVLDFESEAALRYCFTNVEELAKHTPVISTGRGFHVWTRQKGGGKPKSTSYQRKGNVRAFLPLDVQGEGKYAVAPPSIHPNGRTYKFLSEWDGILEVSDELLHAELQKRAEEWSLVEAILPYWKEGTRQNLALGFAKILKYRCGFDDDRVAEIVERTCAVTSDPEVGTRLSAVRATLAKGEEGTAAKSWLGDELYATIVSRAPRRLRSRASTGDVPEHAFFASKLTQEYHFATMTDTDELYVYADGVYTPGAETLVRSRVEEHYVETNSSAKKQLVDEVIAAIRRRTDTKRETFNVPGKLNLKNGVLDLEKLTIEAHDPSRRYTYRLPAAYDPKASCPRFLKFLEEIQPEESTRKTLQEIVGYCFETGNLLQRAFMFVGEGNNGKSTLLGAIADLLGRENISTETLQTLAESRFAAASLWGKLANICADIPSNPVRYTGTFKMATGGDPMRGERKFHDSFSFVNAAKLMFSCNELPEVSDRTRALWRRWIVVKFSEDFTGREDRRLSEKLRGELPGILDWALEGLRVLRVEGDFPHAAGTDSIMEEWRRRADSLYWFVSERIEKEPTGWVAKDVFYEEYSAFCEANSLRAKKPEVVGKELPRHAPWVRAERQGTKGKQIRVWAGIKLKDGPGEEDVENKPSLSGAEQATIDRVGDGSPHASANDVRLPTAATLTTERPGIGYDSQASQGSQVSVPRPPRERGAHQDQHPDFMLALGRARDIRRYDVTRPVRFIVEDLIKELRSLGHEPDVDQLTAGAIKDMRASTALSAMIGG
jgi:P4 family phage/plasmid primase-like protien